MPLEAACSASHRASQPHKQKKTAQAGRQNIFERRNMNMNASKASLPLFIMTEGCTTQSLSPIRKNRESQKKIEQKSHLVHFWGSGRASDVPTSQPGGQGRSWIEHVEPRMPGKLPDIPGGGERVASRFATEENRGQTEPSY